VQDVKLGNLTVKKVFESGGGLPFRMALPDTSADDLAALRSWYWSDELSVDPAAAMFNISIHSYVLQIDGRNILIDTCNGNDKSRSVPFADKLQTPYLANLAAAGLQPQDVDLVLCTHLHCDHVGWNTRLQDGRWVPTFPKARYLFSRRDYAFFSTQQHEALHREAFEDSVLPIVEAGLADMVENDAVVHREIGDGIWLEDAPGHSPGACVINAKRHGSPALFTGDAFHHPIQLVRPELQFFADEDAVLAVATRRRLMESHADRDTVIFPAHFGGASAGRIKREGSAFRFEFLAQPG
jgi:glyoxylase-like metal-dependent hydrolase (beta-lactamase superfamily II)